jgi:hypothetical protein
MSVHSFRRDEIPWSALALPPWLQNNAVLQLKSTSPPARTGESMSVYKNFEIETFELGPNQWHACFRNIDRSLPIVIDDTSFEKLHLASRGQRRRPRSSMRELLSIE